MNRQHLFRYSKSYALLKRYVRFAHSIFYEEVCVVTPENIPLNEPVIFAPNHQNALMDALAILLLTDTQPVFMARADIFKKKTTSKLLNFLKIIPVYRIRDGVDNLSNNTESFGIALRALGYGQAVGIMPEGNHGDQHRLRPLKKGVARFALAAQENFGNTVSVRIVPVGIEYSHYTHFRSKLLVIFGKPIDVSQFFATYKENPQSAYNLLRDRLAVELKRNMLDIDNSEYYDLIYKLKEMYAPRLQQKQDLTGDYYFRFLAEKQITENLVALATEKPDLMESLKSNVYEFYSGLNQLKLRNWVFDAEMPDRKTLYFDIVRYAAFLPLFVIAVAFNIIPYLICDYVARKIKDTQFQSSFKFVVGIFLFPLYYFLFLFFPMPLITKIVILLPMAVLGVLSFDYYIGLKKQWAKFRYFKMLKEKNYQLIGLKQVREQILRTLDTLFL